MDRARYVKLEDGTWAVWVNGPTPEPGDVVEVTKNDGTVNTEIIKSVLWNDEKLARCTIHSSEGD